MEDYIIGLMLLVVGIMSESSPCDANCANTFGGIEDMKD